MSEPSLPRVSVVVPAFRQAAFVPRCLDSIQRQTYRGPIETIVVDDGCPEQSGAVAERHPLGPRVIRQANGGVARARNRGVEAATGELLAFLDADDCWHERKLEAQVAALGTDAALCFTRMRFIDERGTPLDRAPYPAVDLVADVPTLFERNFIGCSTVLVHRRCVTAAGGFPDSPELRRGGQDYALWLRIAIRSRLVYVPEVLTDYSIHLASRVGTDPLRNFRGAVYALEAFEAAEGPVRSYAGRSLRPLVLGRALDMFRALRAEHGDPGDWARAAGAVATALTRSLS